MNRVQSTKYKRPNTKLVQGSNLIILTLVVVESNLVLVRAIFKSLALALQPNAPASRKHLPAHLVSSGGTQGQIWKLRILDGLFLYFSDIDAQTLRQIFARLLNRFFF